MHTEEQKQKYVPVLIFIVDFSLKSYLSDIGLDSSIKMLPLYTSNELLHYLGIANFLLHDQCIQDQLPYFPNKHGWNRGKYILCNHTSCRSRSDLLRIMQENENNRVRSNEAELHSMLINVR